MAEQNSYVGDDTTLMGFSDSGKMIHFMMPHEIANLRQIWLEHGAPRLPAGLSEQMPSLVHSIPRKDIRS